LSSIGDKFFILNLIEKTRKEQTENQIMERDYTNIDLKKRMNEMALETVKLTNSYVLGDFNKMEKSRFWD